MYLVKLGDGAPEVDDKSDPKGPNVAAFEDSMHMYAQVTDEVDQAIWCVVADFEQRRSPRVPSLKVVVKEGWNLSHKSIQAHRTEIYAFFGLLGKWAAETNKGVKKRLMEDLDEIIGTVPPARDW